MSKLTYPSIHLNGTSPDALLALQLNAIDQLRKAISTLQTATPMGRDYYPQGDDAINQALKEHVDRLNRLASVLREIESIAENITRTARAARRTA